MTGFASLEYTPQPTMALAPATVQGWELTGESVHATVCNSMVASASAVTPVS